MPLAAATCPPRPTANAMQDSDPPNPLLLFACVRPELQSAIGQELRASHLRVVVTSNPRDIREVAAEQVIAAVVLDVLLYARLVVLLVELAVLVDQVELAVLAAEG